MDRNELSSSAYDYLVNLFLSSLKAVNPIYTLPPYLNFSCQGQIIVVGAGKAAASMALAIENHFEEQVKGAVVTQYGYGIPLKHITLIEASHPLSDEKSIAAANLMINLVSNLSEKDLVIALISGGGSSLLSLPASDISLNEKKSICKELLLCGAGIHEINTVRKHLSNIKGGRLAKYAEPATIRSFIISDVPGDEPSMVASGPTLEDSTSSSDALKILNYYQIKVPQKIRTYLESLESESPRLLSKNKKNDSHYIISRAHDLLAHASKITTNDHIHTILLGDDINIDSEELGKQHADMIENLDCSRPYIILSGGETSVKVTGGGKGGRNAHYLLSLIHYLDDFNNIYGIACDTDGKDGSEDNAGAIFTPQLLKKAAKLNLDTKQYLLNNDSFTYFKHINGLVQTGPTYTNVNDFRAILVL